jgi:alpha-amylase
MPIIKAIAEGISRQLSTVSNGSGGYKTPSSNVKSVAKEDAPTPEMGGGPPPPPPLLTSAHEFRRNNSRSLLGPADSAAGGGQMMRKGSSSLLDGGGVVVTYSTSWQAPYIHYCKDNGTWTDLPGVAWKPAGEGLWRMYLDANCMEFVCNDGGSGWDKPAGGGNYKIDAPGKYMVRNGKVKWMVPAPRPPTLVVVTEIDATVVELSWNPPDVEEGVTGYVVYQDDKAEAIKRTNVAERFCRVEGLKGMVEYKFSVATVNADGLESLRTEVDVTTSVPGKPSEPTFLQVTSRGPDHVTLAWQPPRTLGGASVTAYHVFRDGVAIDSVVTRDPETGEDKTEFSWKDTSVQTGNEYRYSVSAMHLPTRTPSKSCLLELLTKRASRSLMMVPEDENEGPPCEEVSVRAEVTIQVPRLGERVTHVILQGFNWNSSNNKKGWYNILMSKLSDYKRAGFDMMWLPPPAQSVDMAGYLPSKWYDLTSHYGTHQELVALGRALCSQKIALMMDLVVNHRCASKQDKRGKWTVFEQPEWGAWAICGNDNSGCGEGAQSTGELLEYAPDIDHTNPKVQQDVKDWMAWIFKEVGFCSLRLDFVIGFAPHFQEQYVRAAGSPFAVAEYWHGDVNVLRNYLNKCKGTVAVFDFPVYYTLKHAVRSNEYGGLRWDGNRAPGIMGLDPVRCCSFIENHDTDHLEVVGGCFGNNDQITRGYAYILTHPGTPTVYWTDWSDRGEKVTEKIEQCVQVRFRQGLHCLSKLSIMAAEDGLYAAYIEGNNGKVAMKMGPRDWCPQGGQWKMATYGSDYAIWVDN